MSLLQTIRSNQLEARKQKLEVDASVLTTLLGEVMAVGKNDGNREPNDDDIIRTVRKFLKGVSDTLAVLAKVSAADPRIAVLEREQVILTSFLPAQVGDDQLKAAINALVAELPVKTPKQMGVVMAALKVKFGSTFDAKRASSLIAGELAGS